MQIRPAKGGVFLSVDRGIRMVEVSTTIIAGLKVLRQPLTPVGVLQLRSSVGSESIETDAVAGLDQHF